MKNNDENELVNISLISHKYQFKFLHFFKKAACKTTQMNEKKNAAELKTLKINVHILKMKIAKCKMFNCSFYELKKLKMFHKMISKA